MSENNVAKYILEPVVQRAALRFVLEDGSPHEYLDAMDQEAEAIFNAQMETACRKKQPTDKSILLRLLIQNP